VRVYDCAICSLLLTLRADEPLVRDIGYQYIHDRERHDRTAAEWTRRFADQDFGALLRMYFWLSPALTEVLVSRPNLGSGNHEEFIRELQRLFIGTPLCYARVIRLRGLDARQDLSNFNHSFFELLTRSLCEPVRQDIEHLFYSTKHVKLLPFRDGTFHHENVSQTSCRIGPGDFVLPVAVDVDSEGASIARSSSSTLTTEQTSQPRTILPANSLERALESLVCSVVEDPVRLQLVEFIPPPVLWIDLKRFTYDQDANRTIKNNAAFDFPERFFADLLYRDGGRTFELKQRISTLEAEIEKHKRVLDSVHVVHEFFTQREQVGADGFPGKLCMSREMLEFYFEPLKTQIAQWQLELEETHAKLNQLRSSFTNNPYTLYAIMVHVGNPHRGNHYYAFVNIPSQGWVKLDDGKVTPVTSWQLVRDECIGGSDVGPSASCLVYVDQNRMPHSMAQQALEVLYPPKTLKSWESLQLYLDPLPEVLLLEVDKLQNAARRYSRSLLTFRGSSCARRG